MQNNYRQLSFRVFVFLSVAMLNTNAQNVTVGGTTSTGYLPKFTGSSTVDNSSVFQTGNFIGVHTNTPSASLDVYGTCGVDNRSVLSVTQYGGFWGGCFNGESRGDNFIVKTESLVSFLPFTSQTSYDFIVKNSGNVGIGTFTPSASLYVRPNTGSTNPLNIVNNADNASFLFVKSTGEIGIGTSTPNAKLYVKNVSGAVNPLEIHNASSVNILTVKDNGGLGLGTNNPNAIVDAKNASGIYGWLYHGQNSSGSTRFLVTDDGRASIGSTPAFSQSILTLKSALGASVHTTLDMVAPGNSGWQNQIRFLATNNSIRHLITDDHTTNNLIIKAGSGGGANAIVQVQGKMFIGNEQPNGSFTDYKLGVDGLLVAKRCVVEINQWADNVFEENYPLSTLDEVESFIKQNKHLPEIPSEKEVLESGVSLGEMNALLLKKVEELTLHLIRHQKEIELLKSNSCK